MAGPPEFCSTTTVRSRCARRYPGPKSIGAKIVRKNIARNPPTTRLKGAAAANLTSSNPAAASGSTPGLASALARRRQLPRQLPHRPRSARALLAADRALSRLRWPVASPARTLRLPLLFWNPTPWPPSRHRRYMHGARGDRAARRAVCELSSGNSELRNLVALPVLGDGHGFGYRRHEDGGEVFRAFVHVPRSRTHANHTLKLYVRYCTRFWI
jgi:hypothetical protein